MTPEMLQYLMQNPALQEKVTAGVAGGPVSGFEGAARFGVPAVPAPVSPLPTLAPPEDEEGLITPDFALDDLKAKAAGDEAKEKDKKAGKRAQSMAMLAAQLPSAGKGIGRMIDQLAGHHAGQVQYKFVSDREAKKGAKGADKDIEEFLMALDDMNTPTPNPAGAMAQVPMEAPTPNPPGAMAQVPMEMPTPNPAGAMAQVPMEAPTPNPPGAPGWAPQLPAFMAQADPVATPISLPGGPMAAADPMATPISIPPTRTAPMPEGSPLERYLMARRG